MGVEADSEIRVGKSVECWTTARTPDVLPPDEEHVEGPGPRVSYWGMGGWERAG